MPLRIISTPFILILPALLFLIANTGALSAQAVSQSKPSAARTSDPRLGKARTLEDYFPFRKVQNMSEWDLRAQQIKQRLQVGLGLWPEPTRTPLNAVIHGKVDRPDYTVEKVYFESFPGHFVTGNLYRPKGFSGKRPTILSPHGHVVESGGYNGDEETLRNSGRFYDHGSDGILEKIADGWERFESGGRTPLQARGVQLARMGCVVFQYDMVGYADSLQLQHKRLGPRDHMNTKQNWGLSSPKAELHMQSLMMLQTWNSIRSLEFLLSLADVDTDRVGMEGHSGGGTQVFILAALDKRPDVLFPAVMVGTGMQGGCICENAPYLRIGVGNVDIAALAAPRPMGLTGADDWTLEIREKGLPDLKTLYSMYGVPEHVDAKVFPQFGHNYNSVSRGVMYNWFNKFLELGLTGTVIEKDYTPLSREEGSVWDDQHTAPAGSAVGDTHERALLSWLTQDSTQNLKRLWPSENNQTLQIFQNVLGKAFDVMIDRRLEDVADTGSTELRTGSFSNKDSSGGAPYFSTIRQVSNVLSEQVKIAIASSQETPEDVLIWVHEQGIEGIFEDLDLSAEAADLIPSKTDIVALDLIGQNSGSEISANQMTIKGKGLRYWDRHPDYTYGYNLPLLSKRVHDVLTVIAHMRKEHPTARISLLGMGPTAGPIAALARVQSGQAVHKLAVNTAGFRFGDLNEFTDPMFLPGAAKYLDMPGVLALAVAAGSSWVFGETRSVMDELQIVHKVTGQDYQLVTGKYGTLKAAFEWLSPYN